MTRAHPCCVVYYAIKGCLFFLSFFSFKSFESLIAGKTTVFFRSKKTGQYFPVVMFFHTQTGSDVLLVFLWFELIKLHKERFTI